MTLRDDLCKDSSTDLTGRGNQDPSLGSLGETKHVDGPHRVGLDRLDRVVHVVRGTGGTGQVVDLVHLDVERVDDVVVQHLEVLVSEPLLDVPLAASEVVVSHEDLVSVHHESVHQVGAHEPRPARHQDPLPVLVSPELDAGEGGGGGQAGLQLQQLGFQLLYFGLGVRKKTSRTVVRFSRIMLETVGQTF